MHVSNPFFNTQTKIADVEQLTDRLLALSLKDTQLIGEVSALRNDVSKAQYTAIASSENLLINPRGKINQLNESDGVLAAGQYFCDGWKAGASGAEVYRDADGFRLVSGSIVQLVPNIIDVGRMLRGNMDVVSGTPQIRINGGTDTATADSQKYIKFEVSGNVSKFTRLILAESKSLPIYQQSVDELSPCFPFLRVIKGRTHAYVTTDVKDYLHLSFFLGRFHKIPAATYSGISSNTTTIVIPEIDGFELRGAAGLTNVGAELWVNDLTLDARP